MWKIIILFYLSFILFGYLLCIKIILIIFMDFMLFLIEINKKLSFLFNYKLFGFFIIG